MPQRDYNGIQYIDPNVALHLVLKIKMTCTNVPRNTNVKHCRSVQVSLADRHEGGGEMSRRNERNKKTRERPSRKAASLETVTIVPTRPPCISGEKMCARPWNCENALPKAQVSHVSI